MNGQMKAFFVIIVLISGFFMACNSGTKIDKNQLEAMKKDTTEISFDEDEHDFGKIQQGEVVSHTFEFTNTGKSVLIIGTVKASCGCTVPEWPKDPIKPGEKGQIKVVFDSDGKRGQINKSVSVMGNIPKTKVLHFRAEVTKDEKTKTK